MKENTIIKNIKKILDAEIILFEQWRYKKITEKLFDRFRKSIAPVKTGLFSGANNQYVAGIATAGLQTVSFFTTFAGIRYFFSNINLIVSYIIAFVIQFLFFYTINIAFNKKRKNSRKVMLAIILFVTSVTFSYIGIVNTIENPLMFFEQTLSKYKTDFNKMVYSLNGRKLGEIKKNELNQALFSMNNMEQDKNNLLIALSGIANGEIPETVTIDGRATQYSPIPDAVERSDLAQAHYSIVEGCEGLEPIDESIFLNMVDKIIEDEEFTQKEIYINAMKGFGSEEGKKIISLYNSNVLKYNNYIKQKENAMKEISTENVTQENLKQISVNDFTYFILSQKDLSIDNDIFEIERQVNKNENENVNKSENLVEIVRLVFDSLIDSVNPVKLSNVEEKINEVNSSIYKKNIELGDNIEKIGFLGKDSQGLIDETKKLYDENVPIKLTSSYIIVFSYFTDEEYCQSAIGALFLAILIDGLSLLIPIFLVNNRYSALHIKKRSDIVDEEEDILENLFHAIYTIDQQKKVSAKNLDINQLVDELKIMFVKKIAKFINSFELFPYNIDGRVYLYAIKDDKNELDKNELDKNILNTLVILKYIVQVSGKEIKKLIENDDSYSNKHLNTFNDTDEVFLLNEGLYLWYIDTFSEISMGFSSEYIHDK